MAVSPKLYGLALQSLHEGRINLSQNPLKCMIVGSGYTPNQHVHKFRSVVIDEVQGSGYVTGGETVTGVQLIYEQANKRLKITGGNMVWPSTVFSNARYAVLYVDNGGPITLQPLLAFVDFGESISRDDEPFYITWPASGIMSWSVP